MAHERPFRFGVQCSSPPNANAAAWRTLVRKCEDLGYATVTVADHFDDQLAPIPALMAAANATTTLRVGALVMCVDYAHPVVLAKEAATLDLLSDGRLELGIGAGWMTSDYEQAGIPLDRAGVRIERLGEAITVMKRLWSSAPCSFSGAHYTVQDLDGHPKPVQRPHPPILVGGGGRKVLSLAAREADIVGLNVDLRGGAIDASAGPSGTASATSEKLQWIRDAAGPRFDDIELHVRVHLVAITDDREGMAAALGPAFGITPEEAKETPHALAGSVDEIIDSLVERRERWGISYIGIGLDAIDTMAPVVARLAGN